MSSNGKRKREFPSTFSSESRKFIFQLDLDQNAVKEMLGCKFEQVSYPNEGNSAEI